MGNKIWTFVWRKFLAPLGVGAACTGTFLLLVNNVSVAKTWLGLAADSTPEWYLNMYYNTINDITVNKDGDFPNIIMLDIKENITRKDLADLIPLVVAGAPKVLGIDGTFSTSDSYDMAQTDTLIQVLASLPKSFPIVFATVQNEPSAIPDSVMQYKGFVDAVEYNKYIFHKGETSHFAYEVARQAGYNVDFIDTTSFLINYRKKSFTSIPIYTDFMEYVDYIQDNVKDKVVLIGGLKNRWDMHYVPFLIESNDNLISGSRILAYMLSSVMTASCQDEYCELKSNHYYSRCSWWGNILLSLFFTLAYLSLYILIEYLKKKKKIFELLKPILLFGMLVLILTISMIITAQCFVVPYITFFMVLTLFLGFSYDVFN